MKTLNYIFLSTLLFSLSINYVKGQNYSIQTQTYDLEKIDRHKDWRIYSGYKDNNGNYIVKLGKPSCNMSSGSGNEIGSIKYAYYGMQYDFDELSFDQSFNYISKVSKTFPTTISTLSYEPVLGKRFFPLGHLNLLKRPLSQDYIGRKTVVPVIEMTGFKIGIYQVAGKPVAPGANAFGATNYYSCGENIWFEKLDVQKTKENKGERWFPVSYYPLPGGGVVVYTTSGVLPETDNAVFIAKLYGEDLNEIAKVELPFDFKCVVHILPLEKNDGKRDFVIISQADDGKYSLGKKVLEANNGELLILDGKTLQIKNRSKFKMEYTRWWPENVVVNDNGQIYIYGTTSDDTKQYPGKQGYLPINAGQLSNPNALNFPKDQPNFQILMTDPIGNVKYVKGINSKEVTNISKIITGTEKKANNDVILNTYDFYKECYFTDKYLILAGQQFIGQNKTGADKGNLFVALFDKNTGNLVNYFIKPEDTYATFDIIFNKEKTKLYWATYDWETLNELKNEQGAMSAKKIKSMIAGNLHLTTIDLTNGTSTNFEWLGKEQWAINFNAPLILKDNESDEIIFQGRTLNKKAKDSELIFIKVKK